MDKKQIKGLGTGTVSKAANAIADKRWREAKQMHSLGAISAEELEKVRKRTHN